MGILNEDCSTYRFECYTDAGKKITMEFNTENPCWSGFDGPVQSFFDFLKGCGFVFDVEDQIGVMDKDGNFRSAVDE